MVVPCDAIEAKKATIASVAIDGPVYIRLGREKTPVFTTPETPFTIGRAEVLYDNNHKPDVAIIGCGPMVYSALQAAEALGKEGINARVINNHTVKPIDEATIIKAGLDAGAVVTVEEHQVQGGMGSAVAEVLAKHAPVPIEFIGVQSRFGESGKPEELMKAFGLDVSDIIAAAKKVINRKK